MILRTRILAIVLLFGVGCASISHAQAGIEATLKEVHRAHRAVDAGTVYKSGAKRVDAAWFGIAVATVDGAIHAVGDSDRPFPIQSTAKAFTYGLALEDHGAGVLLDRVGVNATGLPYNSPRWR
jgi:glutaminase